MKLLWIKDTRFPSLSAAATYSVSVPRAPSFILPRRGGDAEGVVLSGNASSSSAALSIRICVSNVLTRSGENKSFTETFM